MKDLENIDDLFSSSLENFEVAPPKEAKKAIELDLQKQLAKKNNKGGWLLLAIISVSIMATAMFVQRKGIKTEDQLSKSSIQSNIIGLNSIEEHNAVENKANGMPSQKVAKSEGFLTYQINSKTDKEYKAPKQNQIQLVATSMLETKQKNEFQQNKLFESSTKNANKIKSNEMDQAGLLNMNNKVEENVDLKNLRQENQILLASSPQPQIFEGASIAMYQNSILPPKKDEIEGVVEVDTSLSEINNLPLPTAQEEPKPKIQHYFVGFNFGTGLNSNQYAKNNSISTQELKDSIIFNKPYLSAQLLCGVQHKNLSISTGIGFYKQNEKIKYSYIDKKMTRILVDSIYIDPFTLDTIVKHNVPVDTLMDIYRTNEVQTVYNLLQIPIMGNYKFALTRHFQLDFSAGGAINILLQSKGNYKVSPQGSVSEYQSKNNAPIKEINFTALTMIGLNYEINNKTSIQMAFPFQIGLSNFYKRDYFISRKVNSAGIQLGLRYNFK